MRFLPLFLALLVFGSAPASSDDVVFPEFHVYELDSSRFARNDRSPTLYKIKLAGKDQALWIEGDDYNYQWLTIVPYDGIKSVVLDRSRGNPFVKHTGSWIGKQFAKAGDIHGWFTISFVDRKGKERETILLAPVNGDQELADFLKRKSNKDLVRQDNLEPEVNSEALAESHALAVSPIATHHPQPTRPEMTTAGPSTAGPPQKAVKLVDVMTVSEFRAAGLGKLTDGELAELDAWIDRYLSTRGD